MPPDCIDGNVYEMTEEERKKAGIKELPGSLKEAAKAFQDDPFIQNVLGEDLSKKYLRAKQKEYAEYSSQVTQWEISRYLQRI